ncbi:CTP-dependent diacylglycerol kinase-like protein [Hapsidospora chrysogenum ATCC 11550]|uniref:CTP-dependent diacylglycerol kinase-like protein n=1 Tax=Hapsidospora chrysogenum (strain ATCC 11550 / CBS 779.69 / DSM 880 / IAM 14645 / JCM 23072 / IMI 49137) TaxID=857340 RepID=A0A086SZ47_HAPC1|nr:CTP-dependent diacylglycerol kinase-like protein [Hapsidospora chrysogenum ATCC 11550]
MTIFSNSVLIVSHLKEQQRACPRPPLLTTTLPGILVHHAVGETTSAASPPSINLEPLDPAPADPASTTTATHSPPPFLLPSLLRCPGGDTQARSSRHDKHLHSIATNTAADNHHTFWPSGSDSLRRNLVGAVSCPALPPFPLPAAAADSGMSMSTRRRKAGVPPSPRVISPSPDPSEHAQEESSSYERPMTRSAARNRKSTSQPLPEDDDIDDGDEAPGHRRSRTRSRSPIDTRALSRMTPRRAANKPEKIREEEVTEPVVPAPNGKRATTTTNGHLAPPQPATAGWTWRDFSRSPSPLGLIPIHRHWRTFVHKHEVPRKFLHVSIGFFVIWLYVRGTQTSSVPPYLMSALVPITLTDWLRHRYAPFNRFYVRMLGALMRESEYAGWNGVIFYLLGAWIVLYFLPKDVGVVSVLLLSWCDSAASTFGRLWGRYTPRLRRGKSLAGSLAAFAVGVATSYFFWGWLARSIGPMPGDEGFMFKGVLSLPGAVSDALGFSERPSITGSLALGAVSLWSGFVASASEVVDVFGWDDNLTIPVLSGIGIWGFLKLFA